MRIGQPLTTKVFKNGLTLSADGGAVYYHFAGAKSGVTAAENVSYITRFSALDLGMDSIYLHNYPEYVLGTNFIETREMLVEYNRLQEQLEDSLPDQKSVQAHKFYRARLSLMGKLDTIKMRELVIEHINDAFPKARAIAAIHQDTMHTHAHIHLLARQVDGQKLELTLTQWCQLDERWGKIFSREFGSGKLKQHLEKKAETREYKRAIARGEDRNKPKRAERSFELIRDNRDRSSIFYGNYEARIGRSERAIVSFDFQSEARKRAVESQDRAPGSLTIRTRDVDSTEREIDRSIKESELLARSIQARVVESQRGYSSIERSSIRAREIFESGSRASQSIDQLREFTDRRIRSTLKEYTRGVREARQEINKTVETLKRSVELFEQRVSRRDRTVRTAERLDKQLRTAFERKSERTLEISRDITK